MKKVLITLIAIIIITPAAITGAAEPEKYDADLSCIGASIEASQLNKGVPKGKSVVLWKEPRYLALRTFIEKAFEDEEMMSCAQAIAINEGHNTRYSRLLDLMTQQRILKQVGQK